MPFSHPSRHGTFVLYTLMKELNYGRVRLEARVVQISKGVVPGDDEYLIKVKVLSSKATSLQSMILCLVSKYQKLSPSTV